MQRGTFQNGQNGFALVAAVEVNQDVLMDPQPVALSGNGMPEQENNTMPDPETFDVALRHHMKVEEELLRGIVENRDAQSNVMKLLHFLPLGIIGLLVLAGSMTMLFAGLPFETKNEEVMQQRVFAEQIGEVTHLQENSAKQLGEATIQIRDLMVAVAALKGRVEADESLRREAQGRERP
jgi:hypothetical protein